MRRKTCPKCKRKLRHKHELQQGGYKCSCGYETQQKNLDRFKKEEEEE